MFLYIACLFSAVALIDCQGYGRRRERPVTSPPPVKIPTCEWGSVGSCGGIVHRPCPVGSTCQLDSPFSTGGRCCRNSPVSVCKIGTPQGTCGGWAGAQCRPGYSCTYRPGSSLGSCCRDPVQEPICKIGKPQGTCGGFVGQQCQFGYTCVYPKGSTLGSCCRDPIPVPPAGQCPPPSGMVSTCEFDPVRNCLSDDECPRGTLCCTEGCGKVCKFPVPWSNVH